MSIGVRVTDGRGGEDTQFFDLDVAAPEANTAPRIVTEVEGLVFLNTEFVLPLVAEDLEDGTSPNNRLVWSLDQASRDRGMELDPFTGRLSWTPRVAGTFNSTVTVTDSGGAYASTTLTLPVNVRPATNQPASFTSRPTGPAVADRSWTYDVRTTDPDGDTVTIEIVNAPDWLDQSIGDTGTGTLRLSGTPTAGGSFRFELRATDDKSAGQTQSFDLLTIANAPPIIVEAVQRDGAKLNVAKEYVVTAFDPNGDTLTFELVSGAGVGSFGPVTATGTNGTVRSTLTFAPDADGRQEVVVRVSDGTDSATHVMTLEVVDETNQPPVARLSTPGFVRLGGTFAAQVDASDPEGRPLTYAFVDVAGRSFTAFTSGRAGGTSADPVGLTIDGSTGALSWTPVEGQQTPADGSPYAFTVRVSDGRLAVDLGPAQVAVVDAPAAVLNAPQFVRAASSAQASLVGGNAPAIDLEFDFIDFDAGNAVSVGWSLVSSGGLGQPRRLRQPGTRLPRPRSPQPGHTPLHARRRRRVGAAGHPHRQRRPHHLPRRAGGGVRPRRPPAAAGRLAHRPHRRGGGGELHRTGGSHGSQRGRAGLRLDLPRRGPHPRGTAN